MRPFLSLIQQWNIFDQRGRASARQIRVDIGQLCVGEHFGANAGILPPGWRRYAMNAAKGGGFTPIRGAAPPWNQIWTATLRHFNTTSVLIEVSRVARLT
jgi:hypothetical protein